MFGMPSYDVYSGATMRWPKPQQQPVTVPQVTSRAGAETLAQQLPPGSSTVALHSDEDLMYVLSTDSAGVPRVTEWRIEEVKPAPQLDPSQFITRQEFMEWIDGGGKE